MKKKSFLYPVVFMIVITAVFTFALSYLNYLTVDGIERNAQLEVNYKILQVFGIAPEEPVADEVEKIFDDSVTTMDWDGKTVYQYEKDGKVEAYAVPIEGPGLWGNIKGYIGVTSDLEHVTGVEFTQQSETPGLGGRIAEAPYKQQYRDLDISGAQPERYIVNRPASDGNIDAIAGATLTSNFVTSLINNDLQEFFDYMKSGVK